MALPYTHLLLTLLFVSVTVPMAQSSVVGGVLGGTLLCTNTSLANVGTYPVIANARVDVVCGQGSLARVIRSSQTNLAGIYYFTFTLVDTILNDPSSCYLNVTIPPNSCIFNVPTGILRIPLGVLSTIDALLGSILVLVPGTLSFLLH